jgi:hypothetical protein
MTGRDGEPSTPRTGNPDACSVAVACSTDWFDTSGIGTGAGPFYTVACTTVSRGSTAPSG